MRHPECSDRDLITDVTINVINIIIIIVLTDYNVSAAHY